MPAARMAAAGLPGGPDGEPSDQGAGRTARLPGKGQKGGRAAVRVPGQRSRVVQSGVGVEVQAQRPVGVTGRR
ncbi:hypothetical protein ACWD0G_15380, partial [Streptomyces goshikiensis]